MSRVWDPLREELDSDQLEQLAAEATAPARNGPSPAPSASFLEQLLGPVRYVRIVRLDVDRQAVWLWTALHSGVRSVRDGAARAPAAEPAYDFDEIERYPANHRRRRDPGTASCAPTRSLPSRSSTSISSPASRRRSAAVLAAILDTEIDPGAVAAPDSARQAGPRSDELRALHRHRARRRAGPAPSAGGARSVRSPGETLGMWEGLTSPDAGHQLTLAATAGCCCTAATKRAGPPPPRGSPADRC